MSTLSSDLDDPGAQLVSELEPPNYPARAAFHLPETFDR